MATWKELGEVPDSDDDEALDAGDSQLSTHITNQDSTNLENQDEHSDLWDVPTSPAEEPQCLPQPAAQRPRPWATNARPLPQDEIPSSPLSELAGHDFDEIAKGFEEAYKIPDSPSPLGQLEAVDATVEQNVSIPSVTAVRSHEGESVQDFERGPRSLRPRKPIQEHPYLLESAQYSKLFKSHGMRPMRVAVEEEQAPQQEQDSQEQEYEEDSQLTAKNGNPAHFEESQPTDPYGGFGDFADLVMSSAQENLWSEDESNAVEKLVKSGPSDENDGIHDDGDDEELPDAAEILNWKSRKRVHDDAQSTPKSALKRPRLKLSSISRSIGPTSSSAQPLGIFDVPPSPPQTSPAVQSVTPVARVNRQRRAEGLTPRTSSIAQSSRPQSPVVPKTSNFIIDLSTSAHDSGLSDPGSLSSSSESEGNADVVETVGKRIRGVLPASWLRLDQKQLKTTSSKKAFGQNSTVRSPRKGVAQRRIITGATTEEDGIFFDDSDDSNDETNLRRNEHIPQRISELPVFEDDADSVVEEDHIDHMVSGSKRSSRLSGGSKPRQKGQKRQTSFRGDPGRHMKQPKITGQLKKSTETNRNSRPREAHENTKKPCRHAHDHQRTKRAKSVTKLIREAPRLSVLDVMEAGAPSFMRIAARTARKRADKGRTSPSQKHIALGTRKDNIDVADALSQWRSGDIRPRASVTALISKRPPSSTPLQPMSRNIVQHASESLDAQDRETPFSSRFSQPRRQIQLTRMECFSQKSKLDGKPHTSVPLQSLAKPKTSSRDAVRPAMLETLDYNGSRQAFDTRKRALDALFRKSRKASPSLVSSRLETTIDTSAEVHRPSCVPNTETSRHEPTTSKRTARPRKRLQPKWVDVAAPQYSHANDPIPAKTRPFTALLEDESSSGSKLLGLGPYGTHFTRHFEIFPLDQSVFFHEETLIGSGRLARALKLQKSSHDSWTPCTFILGEKVLDWNTWSPQVSSELGILLDWVADEMSIVEEHTESHGMPARAMLFALDYMQDCPELSAAETRKAFLARFLEVMQIFANRLETIASIQTTSVGSIASIMSPALTMLSHGLCSALKLDLMFEVSKIENVLVTLAKHTIKILLRSNLSEVRDLYDALQHASVKAAGIREDKPTMICWVTLIHTLQNARIPRSGFWDIVASVICGNGFQSSTDSVRFEQVWHNLFTLLPLGEFDGNGVVVSGFRQKVPLEGWIVPQKLIGRVFAIYKSNSRQAPSFNDYCRTLLGRCHYLIEQWGWRKANAVIGLVFDFFASQGLSHLRNEEAFKSPQFLEDLPSSPSLSLVAEDRCFHIFLKLLALTIKNLVEAGMIKDVKNIVARVMPNHDRHYNKEMEMHQSDLAALRNHHDLLCTLFWAAPVELRPSAQIIEKLVLPESSHKEACLVNLRAWGQLSRFVISREVDASVYRPLASWMRNITQQLLQQYLSAEADVKQQFASLSNEASRSISQDLIDVIISTNKKAALEVISASMASLLTTMQHALGLNLATLVFSNYPLEAIFTEIQSSFTDAGWHCLRLGADIVDLYVSLIQGFSSRDAHPDPDCQWHSEEALEFLERNVLKYYFRTARKLLDGETGHSNSLAYVNCLDQLVSLGGRLAACLNQAKLAALPHFFAPGRYGAFPLPFESTANTSRKFVTLFLATLISNGVIDFQALKPTGSLLAMLLCAIVKPYKFLKYENRLAAAVQQSGAIDLPKVMIRTESQPDYISNRELFSTITFNMRKALQEAEPGRRLALKAEFATSVKLVMEQIKSDLKLMTRDSQGQNAYIEFIRIIINIIRSRDFIPVDQFFYQISQEYSPPSQDPRLQAAGILSYGLKLEEGDSRAAPGLFYLLFANFKIALANDRLNEERLILEQGLEHQHIFKFMLGRMLPALIQAAGRAADGWVLVDTYAWALRDVFCAPAVHKNMGKDQMADLVGLLACSFDTIQHLAAADASNLRYEHLFSLTMVFMLLNMFGPSIMVYLMTSDYDVDSQSAAVLALRTLIASISSFVDRATEYLVELITQHETKATGTDANSIIVVSPLLFDGVDEYHDPKAHLDGGGQIKDFSQHILDDIERNWISTGSALSVKGPSRPQGRANTQTGRGVAVPKWDRLKLVSDLLEQLKAWTRNYGSNTSAQRNSTTKRWWATEDLWLE